MCVCVSTLSECMYVIASIKCPMDINYLKDLQFQGDNCSKLHRPLRRDGATWTDRRGQDSCTREPK